MTNSTELMTVDKGPVKHQFPLSTNMNAAINEIDKIQMNTTENPLNNVSYQFETNSTIWVVSTPVTTPVSIIRTTTSDQQPDDQTTAHVVTINEELIIFNVVVFGVLPLLFILIRLKNRNIPKIELFGAYASILFYAQTIFYSNLYGKKVAHYYHITDFGNQNFAFNIVQTIITGFLKELGLFLIVIIPFNLFVVTPGVLANLCCCWYCMLSNIDDSLDHVRTLLKTLEDTGPTMVRAKMDQRGATKDWSFYVNDVQQFVYKTWKNKSISGVDEMEKILENDKIPLKLKFELEIKPEDDETEIEYLDWCWGFPILEEIVTTTEHLKAFSERPHESTPSLQIANLATNRNTKPLGKLPRNAWFNDSVMRENKRYR